MIILAVAIESDRKNNKFIIIDPDFISKAIRSLIQQEDISKLGTIKSIKLPPGHSVLKCSHQQDEMGRLLSNKMTVIPLCGTPK